MAIKIAFAFLIAFVLCQVFASPRIVRDAGDASDTINNVLDSVKTGFDDLVSNIQSNELIRNATQLIEGFADSIKTQGNELLDKIKTSKN